MHIIQFLAFLKVTIFPFKSGCVNPHLWGLSDILLCIVMDIFNVFREFIFFISLKKMRAISLLILKSVIFNILLFF